MARFWMASLGIVALLLTAPAYAGHRSDSFGISFYDPDSGFSLALGSNGYGDYVRVGHDGRHYGRYYDDRRHRHYRHERRHRYYDHYRDRNHSRYRYDDRRYYRDAYYDYRYDRRHRHDRYCRH